MALKITEIKGKLVIEGNINSVTSRFLKKHIQIMKESTFSNDSSDANLNLLA